MRKTLLTLLLTLAMAVPCMGANSPENTEKAVRPLVNPAGNPVAQFTGVYWTKSDKISKEAYIFGIDSAVAVENYIANELVKSGKISKAQATTLSSFEKGWMEAFKNMTRGEIVEAVDAWYTANPDKLERPVLNVLWWEVVDPRLQKNK